MQTTKKNSVVVKDLRLKDKDKDLMSKDEDKDNGLQNWSSRILEDKDFPRGQQYCCEAVR